jgi:hypothetical protein
MRDQIITYHNITRPVSDKLILNSLDSLFKLGSRSSALDIVIVLGQSKRSKSSSEKNGHGSLCTTGNRFG